MKGHQHHFYQSCVSFQMMYRTYFNILITGYALGSRFSIIIMGIVYERASASLYQSCVIFETMYRCTVLQHFDNWVCFWVSLLHNIMGIIYERASASFYQSCVIFLNDAPYILQHFDNWVCSWVSFLFYHYGNYL